MYKLTEERGLKSPLISLDEGFKVTIWRPSAIINQITDHVTDHVDVLIKRLLLVLSGEMSRQELMDNLDLRHAPNFRENYLYPALEADYIEMTLPDKPKSTRQKYRLTPKGLALKKKLEVK